MTQRSQFYHNNTFDVPDIKITTLNPFPKLELQISKNQQRDKYLEKIFNFQHQFKSNSISYCSQFQQIIAAQNLFPFMIDIGPNKLFVVCKECFIVCDWYLNQSGLMYEGGDDIIKIQKSQRIKLSQQPTAIKIGKYSAYFGFSSGQIRQYVFQSRSWQGSNELMQFPIVQIQIVKQTDEKQASIINLDSAGNVSLISFSHKTLMNRIIKTMSTDKWLFMVYRNKKRQKIKKLFKNLIKEKDKQSSNDIEEVSYSYNRMAIRYVQQYMIIAIYRKNKLQIIKLDSNLSLITSGQIQRNNQIQGEVSFIQFGQGGFTNSNTIHNMLLLGVGKVIQCFKLVQAEQNFQVVKLCQIKTEKQLIFGNIISNNLLLLIYDSCFSLSNSTTQPVQFSTFDITKFSYLDYFIQQQNLQFDKKMQIYNIFRKIPVQNNECKFICLQGKRLYVGNIFEWNIILQKLIAESKWSIAMYCSQRIYNGVFKLCANLSIDINERQKDMQRYVIQINKGYLSVYVPQIIKKMQQQSSKYLVNNFIYYNLKSNQLKILFYLAEEYFNTQQLVNLFLSQLSHYIEQSNGYQLKIGYISQFFLKKIILKYRNSNMELLQHLFMGFDMELMEKLQVLTTCLRQGLYHSLITICSAQKDYITPIVKLCGLRLSNNENNQRIKQVLFWYLGQCLAGRMTQFGNQSEYINMLAMLINFLFIPSSLEMILSTSPSLTIQIIYMLFQPRILRYVLQNESYFFMRKDSQNQDLVFEDSSLNQYRLYEKMLSVLIKVVQKDNSQQKAKLQLQLNKFLITIMLKSQFPFLNKLKIKAFLFYINHPFLFLNLAEEKDMIDQENQLYINGHMIRLLDSIVRSVHDKCLSLRQKIKQDPASIKQLQSLMMAQKQKQLNKILQNIILSAHNQYYSQIKCYIYHQLSQFSQVIQLFLRMNNKKTRTKIFQYLKNNLNIHKKIVQQFLKNLTSLLRIDEKLTINLLWTISNQSLDEQVVIDKLIEYPLLQLSYIQKIVQDNNNNANLNKGFSQKYKKLLLLHLDIVLRQNPNNVHLFIQKMEYPLEQAFKMCEQRKNRMGKACILIKSGRNMQGVILMSEMFLQLIQQFLKTLFKKNQYDIAKKQQILKQLDAVLYTCKKQWIVDKERGEQIWEKNTQLIFKKLNINNIDSPHIPTQIRQILNQIVTKILEAMLTQVSTDFFLQRFVKTFSSIPLRIFLQAFSLVKGRLQFLFTILKLNKELLQINEYNTWLRITKYLYQGHVCTLSCLYCNSLIGTNERMFSYNCNHVFHQQCYYQYCRTENKSQKNELCPICFNNLDGYLLFGQQKATRYRLLINENQLIKAKVNKMNSYDRISVMNNFDTWGQDSNIFD